MTEQSNWITMWSIVLIAYKILWTTTRLQINSSSVFTLFFIQNVFLGIYSKCFSFPHFWRIQTRFSMKTPKQYHFVEIREFDSEEFISCLIQFYNKFLKGIWGRIRLSVPYFCYLAVSVTWFNWARDGSLSPMCNAALPSWNPSVTTTSSRRLYKAS